MLHGNSRIIPSLFGTMYPFCTYVNFGVQLPIPTSSAIARAPITLPGLSVWMSFLHTGRDMYWFVCVPFPYLYNVHVTIHILYYLHVIIHISNINDSEYSGYGIYVLVDLYLSISVEYVPSLYWYVCFSCYQYPVPTNFYCCLL